MEVAGREIDILFGLQAGITVLLIGGFSAFTAYRQDEAHRLSDLHAAALVAILVDDHPDVDSHVDVVEATAGYHDRGYFTHIPSTVVAIIEGDVSDGQYHRRALEVYGYVFMSPILLWVGVQQIRERRMARLERLESTSQRRNDMAKVSLGLVGSLAYLAAGLLLLGRLDWAAYAVCGVGVAGFLGAILVAGLIVRDQVDWKTYWRDRLAEVILASLRSDGQASTVRAMVAKQEVDASPTVPLPAALGFYVAVFSITQAVLLWISTQVSWL